MIKNRGLNLRRLRQNSHIRELVREFRVFPEQMIQPVFVVEGIQEKECVPGLTGTFRDNPESILKTIEADLEAGVRKFIIFGVGRDKRAHQFDSSFTAKQIEAIRKRFGKDVFLAVDVCLCSSTVHGHCGVLSAEGEHVVNGATVNELSRLALSYVQAGADCVAPSDMMDGRVAGIREILDQNGYEQALVMSYSAKFHSRFYGPFRVAADSAPKGENKLKDRATYQIDPACPRDAYLSSLRDAEEGADILMVKPALPYLDVLADLSSKIAKPWAVYEVSGEFAGIELMAQQGLVAGPAAHLEAWTGCVRAGASIIISYGARFARQYLERI